MFRIKSPGLNGVPGSISFESVLRPGYYIVNKNGMIDVDSLSNSGFNEVNYNNECSWYARKNLYFNGFTSFESTTRPGIFIRHSNRKLQSTTIGTQSDRNDASFLMNDAFTGGQADLYVESWTTLLGKTITIESKAVPSYFWQTDAKEAFLQSRGEVFRMVEGVSGEANTVSFESTSRPGYYLCVAGNKVIIVRLTNNSQMKKDCSFTAWSDKFFDGYVSFQVSSNPDTWVRQDNRQLVVSTIDTYRDNNDASFLLSETSYVPTTTTTTTTTITTTTTTTTTTRPRRTFPEPCKIQNLI